MNLKLLALGLLPLLVACGSGSSDSNNQQDNSGPSGLTTDNLSQAIIIQGAEPVNVAIPDDLPESNEITNTDKVIVSANSNFSLTLVAPSIANKVVAGYLIELPDGTQQFIHTDEPILDDGISTAPNLVVSNPNIVSKKSKIKYDLQTRHNLSESNSDNEMTVVISGWSISDFSLEESLEDLIIRILPLMVNDSISNISELTIQQILDAEGFEIPAVQELALAVEAVATSTIQISLTWDTETDLDLYILEPDYTEENEKVISYFNHVSSSSLGWLDRDNTFGYGPENITFNYKMPTGNYQVAVNYYSGLEETNYSITIAISGEEPIIYNGTFSADSSNQGDLSDQNGTDIVHTISIDTNLISKLNSKVSLEQWIGVWQLPEDATSEGYFKIEDDGITPYINYTSDYEGPISGCESYGKLPLNYLPTGFIVDGDLKVSDSFSYQYDQNATYAYKTLTKVDDSAISECTIYDDEF